MWYEESAAILSFFTLNSVSCFPQANQKHAANILQVLKLKCIHDYTTRTVDPNQDKTVATVTLGD